MIPTLFDHCEINQYDFSPVSSPITGPNAEYEYEEDGASRISVDLLSVDESEANGMHVGLLIMLVYLVHRV